MCTGRESLASAPERERALPSATGRPCSNAGHMAPLRLRAIRVDDPEYLDARPFPQEQMLMSSRRAMEHRTPGPDATT